MSVLKFQAIKWEVDNGESANNRENNDQDVPRNTSIYIYGLSEDDKKVAIKIPNFKPWVYLELDKKIKWDKGKLEVLYIYLKKRLNKNNPIRKKYCKKKKAYYSEPAEFVYLTFNTIYAIKELEYICKQKLTIYGIGSNLEFTVHEQKADPILKLLTLKRLLPTGWISIKDYEKYIPDEHNLFATTDIQLVVDYEHLNHEESVKICNPLVLSYDIECISSDSTGMTFPNAKRKQDKVIVISATIGKYFSPESSWKNYSLVNAENERKCPKIEGCIIKNFKNEKSLLLGWREFMIEQDPDVIISYNGLTFDDKYIADRADVLLIWQSFSVLGRAILKKATLTERNWTSSAYGPQKFNYLDIPGRLHIDMLPVISKEFQNLSSYNLNSVSEEFLKENKVDLPAKQMIQIYHFGGKESMKKIVEYCNQDTKLPFKLMKHLNSWVGLAEVSNVMKVQIFDYITRGQQIRVYSQILYKTILNDIVCNHKWSDYTPTDLEKQIMGATVQNPKVGLWELVACFDFKSLYPSTIIAYNICFSTFVQEHINPPPEDYHTINVSSHQGCEHDKAERKTKVSKDKIICKEEVFRFYKEHIVKGIIPSIAQELLNAREATKKELKRQIKENGDPTVIQVLDKRQDGIKKSANSMYGSFATDYSELPFYPAGAATTAKGRDSIQKVIEYMIEKRPDSEIIYGDSVTEDTPILCRHNNRVFYCPIYDLPRKKIISKQRGKTYYLPVEGWEVWSDSGFTPIKKIIEHETTKEIFGIYTENSYIEVTEDHSLLDEFSNKITPNEIKIGQKLLSKDLPETDLIIGQPIDKCDTIYNAEEFFSRNVKGLNYEIIIKMKSLGKEKRCVYDLETENHHFAAGVGRLIVHNTDSCMIKFKDVKDVKTCFEVCHHIEKEINKIFPPPMYLEFEKINVIFFLLKKKNYLSMYLKTLDGVLEHDKKGVVSKRRDNCELLRSTYDTLIDLVMTKRPKWEVYEFLSVRIKEIIDKTIELNDLIITKSIKENYKSANLPHLAVANKMKSRGKYVALGTRIPYIFVETDNKKDPQYKKAEDPDYYLENKDKVKIDWLYYLEKQMVNPIDEVLEIRYNSKDVLNNLVKLLKKNVKVDIKEYFTSKFEIVEELS